MAGHSCINGTVDETNYSSPVPVIGLYIAGATLVCMLLMICDTVVGCYSRKWWLPCKMFKLNSITLTLVTVAVKLTVDLTTPMPNVLDQLSKLCGSSLLCGYMGFIMPSVGVMNDSTNMYSLSILVITVFVNTCIQISTGVVVLFIPEHIIILCIMLTLLGMVWCCVWDMKIVTRHTRETSKNLFRRSKETVLERLKICYLYGYGSDTQFIACKEGSSISVGGLNLFCLTVLLQAAYRSVIKKSEKLCIGNSDYEWSMHTIVVTQILTVIVGSSVSISRWLTMIVRNARSYIGAEEPYESNPIFIVNRQVSVAELLQFLNFFVIFIIIFPVTHIVVVFTRPIFLFSYSFIKLFFSKAIERFESGNKNAVKKEFKYLIEDKIGIDEWTLGKGLAEMENEIEVSKSEPNDLFQLLSKITPSQQSQVEHISDRVGESIPVSTLSVVLLIRIAQVSLPKHLNISLVKTFREAYKFICFIENNLFLRSPKFAKKLEVAKAVWSANDFSYLVDKTFDECATGQSQFDTNCALAIIAEVKSKMPEDMIYSELCIIENFINRQQYSSVKELYDYIEQLYIDMLHVILAQFPTAMVYTLSIESTSEDYLDRVRLALKFVRKMELLEAQIHWKFPQGSNLLGLVTASVVLAIEVEAEDSTATVVIHDDNDVIIEVEDSNLRTVC